MALGATFQLLPKIKREWVVSLLLKMLQVCRTTKRRLSILFKYLNIFSQLIGKLDLEVHWVSNIIWHILM